MNSSWMFPAYSPNCGERRLTLKRRVCREMYVMYVMYVYVYVYVHVHVYVYVYVIYLYKYERSSI